MKPLEIRNSLKVIAVLAVVVVVVVVVAAAVAIILFSPNLNLFGYS